MRPPQGCPSPTRRYRPRTFGYPCCGLGSSAGYRRRSGKHPRGTGKSLAPQNYANYASALTFPVRRSSSFWFLDGSTSTPALITTFRTRFSPMKFLISTSYWSVSLFFSMLTLMGKLDVLLVGCRCELRIVRNRKGLVWFDDRG